MPATESAPRQFDGDFQTDFLSVDQLTVDDLWRIFREADAMKDMARIRGVDQILEGHVYDLVFWESDSTRTKYSYYHAVERLGGQVVPFEEAGSSKGKNESFERTIEMLDGMLIPERDGLIIRHNKAGMVAVAAEIADARVINAGDGTNEHPTQAVLDGKTVVDITQNVSGLHVVYFGDLARARTVKSSSRLKARLGVERMTFVAPCEEMRIDPELLAALGDLGVTATETDDLREVIRSADVVYATRTQYNLMPEDVREAARKRLHGLGLITFDMMRGSKTSLMHALPEDEEDPNIDEELRKDPRCIVKKQASNGQWTRMAYLALQANKAITEPLAEDASDGKQQRQLTAV